MRTRMHVFVVMPENADAAVAIEQPFLSELASRGAALRNYHALTHPSQPNYIALVAGIAYSIQSDDPITVDVPHLGDLFDSRGLSWKVYAENDPGDSYIADAWLRARFAPLLDDPRFIGGNEG